MYLQVAPPGSSHVGWIRGPSFCAQPVCVPPPFFSLTLFSLLEQLILPVLELHINGVTQYVIFRIYFFPFSIVSVRFIQVACSFLLLCSIPSNVPQLILPFTCWVVLYQKPLWMRARTHSVVWNQKLNTSSLLVAFPSVCTLPWKGQSSWKAWFAL